MNKRMKHLISAALAIICLAAHAAAADLGLASSAG